MNVCDDVRCLARILYLYLDRPRRASRECDTTKGTNLVRACSVTEVRWWGWIIWRKRSKLWLASIDSIVNTANGLHLISQ
jgi:hypothetical protein